MTAPSGSLETHVRGRIDATFVDLGAKDLKNIVRPIREGTEC